MRIRPTQFGFSCAQTRCSAILHLARPLESLHGPRNLLRLGAQCSCRVASLCAILLLQRRRRRRRLGQRAHLVGRMTNAVVDQKVCKGPSTRRLGKHSARIELPTLLDRCQALYGGVDLHG